MEEYEVIIIGAGAAGLMAARELTRAGKKVVVLEARERTGGRIYTINNTFSTPTEAGAEFVHGNLPVTLELLKEGNIAYTTTQGESWQYKNNRLSNSESFMNGWEIVMEQLKKLEHDTTVKEFLDTHFSGDEYSELRKSLTGFVEGYDAADVNKASIFAFRDELMGDSEWEAQYRLVNGYGELINFLEKEVTSRGGTIRLLQDVKRIHWAAGKAEVVTSVWRSFKASKVIITIPLGLLREGAIDFFPTIEQKIMAAQSIGYGNVIKILLQFKELFWQKITAFNGATMSNMGFLFSEATIPTWWTQFPSQVPLLTGWLAGTRAESFKDKNESDILNEALHSLSIIFKLTERELKEKLDVYFIANWSSDPHTHGAYAYTMVKTLEARKVLNEPILETLFFAGEALYEGPEMGTVEAALASGLRVAKAII